MDRQIQKKRKKKSRGLSKTPTSTDYTNTSKRETYMYYLLTDRLLSINEMVLFFFKTYRLKKNGIERVEGANDEIYMRVE